MHPFGNNLCTSCKTHIELSYKKILDHTKSLSEVDVLECVVHVEKLNLPDGNYGDTNWHFFILDMGDKHYFPRNPLTNLRYVFLKVTPTFKCTYISSLKVPTKESDGALSKLEIKTIIHMPH